MSTRLASDEHPMKTGCKKVDGRVKRRRENEGEGDPPRLADR